MTNLIYVIYILSFLPAIFPWTSTSILFLFISLITCFLLKKRFVIQKAKYELSHIEWQLDTLFIIIGLIVGFFIFIFIFFGFIGSDQVILSKLENITKEIADGTLPFQKGLVELLGIKTILSFSIPTVLFLFMITFWPLQRVIQGILASFKKIAPANIHRSYKIISAISSVILIILLWSTI